MMSATAACIICGAEFRLRRRSHAFCSKSCHQRFRCAFLEWHDFDESFWERVTPEPNTGCWLWTGAINASGGYGAVRRNGVTYRAHAVAMYLGNGRWPLNQALHRCDQPSCVNPSHLYDGTPLDNVRDAIDRGRSRNQFGPWHRRAA